MSPATIERIETAAGLVADLHAVDRQSAVDYVARLRSDADVAAIVAPNDPRTHSARLAAKAAEGVLARLAARRLS